MAVGTGIYTEQEGITEGQECADLDRKYARAYCAAKSISVAGINVFKMSQSDSVLIFFTFV